jgi:hypothetical protein
VFVAYFKTLPLLNTMASNGMMINKFGIKKDAAGSGRGLI